MVQIVGKYQLTNAENFEEFMKTLGHPELVAAFVQAKPLVEIQQNGDQWVITVNTEGKVSSATFKLNEPYEEKLPLSGRGFQSVTRQEGSGFKTETQVGEGLTVYRLYEFTDSEMRVSLSTSRGDVKATRTYKRL